MAGNQGPSRPNRFVLPSEQSINEKAAEKRRQLKQLELQFASNSSIPFSNNALGFPSYVAQPENIVNNDVILQQSNNHRTNVSLPSPHPPTNPPDLTSVTSDKCNKDSSSRLKMCQSIQSSGKLKLSPDTVYDFTSEDLQDLGEIGRGGFGTVNKMIHRSSDTVMAVKRIRSTVDEKDQRQLLMDLDVVMKSNECPYIVQFYGALFKEDEPIKHG
ncbi:hypothetical protein M8J77_024483 [Diaphorina citri]|nr:hypothetical protein M8J77_024483 [Diaphorina citri]